MIDMDGNDGTTREELVERVALMEAMIAEGRQATGRYGWIFVLWGLVDMAGFFLQSAWPHSFWPWPTVLSVGIGLQLIGLRIFCAGSGTRTVKNRALTAVWRMMGITLMLYCFSGMFSHHAEGRSYVAAIFMIFGLAHGISAMILRWSAQGAVSVVWLVGGVGCYVITNHWMQYLFVAEMCVGMVLFGLYAMALERRRAAAAQVLRHG